jgi:hypothetical protein
MQDGFREVLQDIVYRRWRIAMGYWHSLKSLEYLYTSMGQPVPASLQSGIAEAEELIDYLQSDKMFNPNRNLQVRACTLRAST